MRKLRWWIAVLVLVALAGGWYWKRADKEKASPYRFATIEKSDIEATVAATGALSAVTTVQVGTQVSGQVSAIHADFNDKVKKGQLLARIDPVLPQQAVEEALAGVERAQAQYDAGKREYDRNQKLFDEGLLPASELTGYQSTFEVAKANLTSARVALERAKRNLEYTTILSPIDGVIVERNVDVGQTVASSLSAPTLFLIANDLSHMQILASVGESDIGAITDGQQVHFTVQTYPNQQFTGTVQQVRLQSKTVENVVNYTVVIEVQNPDGKLLPGMTASVDFLTGSRHDVLVVPNAALRFRPTEAMLAELRASHQGGPGGQGGTGEQRGPGGPAGQGGASGAAGSGAPGATGDQSAGATGSSGAAGATEGALAGAGGGGRRNGRENGGAGGGARGGSGGGPFPAAGGNAGSGATGGSGPGGAGSFLSRLRAGGGAALWHLDDQGKLAVLPVRVGLSDGQRTEVTSDKLAPGMQIIVGVNSSGEQAAAQPSSPFQSGSSSGGSRGFRPGGF